MNKPRIDKKYAFPLSIAQRGIYFLHQVNPVTTAYNIVIIGKLVGKVDIKLLEKAFNKVIERHEALRMSFQMRDGNPVQILDLKENIRIKIKHEKLQNTEYFWETVKNIAAKELFTIFNLKKAPLMRVTLTKENTSHSALVLCIHHLIADGWSLNLLFQEISIVYKALNDNTQSVLPELKIQYSDYAVWQNQFMKSVHFSTGLEYWEHKLSDLQELTLPSNSFSSKIDDKIGICRYEFDFLTSKRIKEVALEKGVSLYTVLLASFKVFLHFLTIKEDIVIGSPVWGRDTLDLEFVIGHFVNPLVLRTKITSKDNFIAVIDKVALSVREGLKYQYVPFEKVVERLNPQRTIDKNPLFQINFVFQNIPLSNIQLNNDLNLEMIDLEMQHSRFDFECQVWENDNIIAGIFIYSQTLYTKELIECYKDFFLHINQQITSQPHTYLRDFNLLPKEHSNLLSQLHRKQTEELPTNKLSEIIEDRCKNFSQKVAVSCEGDILKFEELDDKVNQFANYLKYVGINSEHKIGIFLQPSVNLMVSLLGLLKIGVTYVTLDTNYPKERLKYILKDANASFIITDNKLNDFLNEDFSSYKIVNIDCESKFIETQDKKLESLALNDNLPAYILYTSGSTGFPKGVIISRSSLNNYLNWCQKTYFGLGRGKGSFVYTSIGFDLTITSILSPLFAGEQVYFVKNYDDDNLLVSFLRQSDTLSFLKLTPSHLRVLNEALSPEEMNKCTDCLIIGGETLTYDLIKPWLIHARHVKVINEYGPTEATVGCSAYFVDSFFDGSNQSRVLIGEPINNCQLFVLNKDLQKLPFGAIGELYIGGAQLAYGYVNQARQTAAAFIPNPFSTWVSERLYKTGDLARYFPNAKLDLVGRIDDYQIKIRGYRIELGEVEKTIKNNSEVKDVIVYYDNFEIKSGAIYAFVILYSKSTTFKSQLLRYLEQILPSYMIPYKIIIIDHFPLTIHGKIDKEALSSLAYQQKEEAEFILQVAESNSLSEIEIKLIEIWKKVLQKEKIDIHDNFFSLGGDSIQALLVVNYADKSEILLSPKTLLQYQTIHKIAQHCSSNKPNNIRDEEDFNGLVPLSPIQHWFFSSELNNYNHYNQSLLLQGKKGTDKNALEQAIRNAVNHHSIFKIRFHFDTTWHQKFNNSSDPIKVDFFDFSQYSLKSRNQQMMILADIAHSELDIKNGPVIKCCFFQYNKDEYYLLIVIHHLYVDGVSWSILLADIESIYNDIINGTEIKEKPFNISYKTWVKSLKNNINSEACHNAVNKWLTVLDKKNAKIKSELKLTKELTQRTKSIHFIPEKDISDQLLRIFAKDNIDIERLLLTALSFSIAEITDGLNIRMHVESHGRGSNFDHVNITNLVGWFTAIYPVSLNIRNECPIEAYNSNCKQLNKLPDPRTFEILKYYTNLFDKFENPEILFNYLGNVVNNRIYQLFEITDKFLGNHRDPGRKSQYIFEVNAFFNKAGLNILWEYRDIFNKGTINSCVKRFNSFLKEFVKNWKERGGKEHYALSDNTIELASNDKYAPFPLTEVQQAYWIGRTEAFDFGRVSCHIYQEIEFSHINVDKFNIALNKVIHRHDMLMAVINNDGTQQILSNVPEYKIQLFDLQNYSSSDQQQQIEEIRTVLSHKVRECNIWPLFDIYITIISNNCYRIHFSFDLLIIDGWSLHLIGKELFQIYADENITLPKLNFSFRDYILAYEKLKKTDFYTKALKYWEQKVANFPLAPELPLVTKKLEDTSRPKFIRKEGRLEKKEWDQIKLLATRLNLTPSALLLSTYAETLGKWSSTPNFTINLTLYNRMPFHTDVKCIAGDFTSLSLIAITRERGESFYERTLRVQEQLWENIEYNIVSGVDVLRMLSKRENYSNHILMPFVLTSALSFDIGNEGGINELGGNIVFSLTQTPQVWLDHQIFQENGSLVFYWDYIDGLFPNGLIDQMFDYYKFLLGLLIKDDISLGQKYFNFHIQNV